MNNKTTSDDLFASKFLTGHTIFPDDQRIFHRPGFEYDDICRIDNSVFSSPSLTARLTYRSGEPGELSIQPAGERVLRIRIAPPGASFEEHSPMLMPFPEELPPGEFADNDRTITYLFQGYRIEIDRIPFCMRVLDPQGETIFESETERLVGRFTAPPAGIRRQVIPSQAMEGTLFKENSGPLEENAFFSWRIRSQDRTFGLGEKFSRLEKTGTRTTIWQADTCGSNTTDMSYKAVPAIFCTAGWGLLLHSSFRSYWEIGSFSYATGSLLVEEPRLDLFLILAPTLKDQIIAYTALTGRPSMPPRWAFGVWMSKSAYNTRDELWEAAARLRTEGIPCDTLNIDGTYMPKNYYDELGVMVCNFGWNTEAWGVPEDTYALFAGLGFGICLWMNPYFSEDSPVYHEAKQKGYLVRTTSGDIARLEFDLKAGIIDLTNPAAKAWWQAYLEVMLRQGASVFKVDFGDRIPENALFYNGKTGREMHNLYVHLYSQAVFEVTQKVKGSSVIWRRPGYIGSQRFPGSWAGDTQVSWEGMAGALRGGLSAAFTGESFWSHDIGGFVGPQPSEELYIRWAQFGMLSPFTRFHGTTPREPWNYSQRAVEIVREYARLRYSLIPYLLACANESVESGLPILRPLVVEYPNEPKIDTIDDQYLLGPDLLFAPVLRDGARTRPVYLPRGNWWAYDKTAPPLAGPSWHEVEAPLQRSPLFARSGAVIPRYHEPLHHLKGPAPKDWLLDIYPGTSRRSLVIPDSGFTLHINYTCENGSSRLEVSPAPITLSVRLVDRRPVFLRADGAGLQAARGGATFVIDASKGVKVEFKV